MPTLLIATVNYKTADLAIKCIQSVANELHQLPSTKMVIVDNDSQDNSVEVIGKAIADNHWSEWCSVVDAGKNGGFSFGNNMAMRPALAEETQPDYIWLLNPDAELKDDAGKVLIDFLESHPKAGMATSACVDISGQKQTMAFRQFTPLGEFVGMMQLGFLDKLFPNALVAFEPVESAHQADWLSGSSLMMKLDVVKQLGLMDEEYFLYFEESDYCVQAKRNGWELWYVPDSKIFHVIGASTGVTRGSATPTKKSARRPDYWFYSRRRYFVKNFGKAYATLADIAHLTGFMLWRLRRLVQQKPDFDPPHYLSDFFRNSVFMKGFKI